MNVFSLALVARNVAFRTAAGLVNSGKKEKCSSFLSLEFILFPFFSWRVFCFSP